MKAEFLINFIIRQRLDVSVASSTTFFEYLPVNGVYIVNTDEASGKGKHWVVFNVRNRNTIFFDPLGHPPTQYFSPERCDLLKPFVINNKQIQSLQSKDCGLYCIVIAKMLAAGITVDYINSCFSRDLHRNDKTVRTMFM